MPFISQDISYINQFLLLLGVCAATNLTVLAQTRTLKPSGILHLGVTSLTLAIMLPLPDPNHSFPTLLAIAAGSGLALAYMSAERQKLTASINPKNRADRLDLQTRNLAMLLTVAGGIMLMSYWLTKTTI